MSVLSQVSHEMCFKDLAWKYSHIYVHAYTHTNDAFDPGERNLLGSSQKEFINQTGWSRKYSGNLFKQKYALKGGFPGGSEGKASA